MKSNNKINVIFVFIRLTNLGAPEHNLCLFSNFIYYFLLLQNNIQKTMKMIQSLYHLKDLLANITTTTTISIPISFVCYNNPNKACLRDYMRVQAQMCHQTTIVVLLLTNVGAQVIKGEQRVSMTNTTNDTMQRRRNHL